MRALGVLTCLVALGLVLVTRLGPTTTDLHDQLHNRDQSRFAHATAGGRRAGVDVRFVEWARPQIRKDQTYWLEPAGARASGAIEQWITFRLLPRAAAQGPQDADVVIWYGGAPRALPGFGHVARFAPGFALATRARDE
jgi:hypothetical protein